MHEGALAPVPFLRGKSLILPPITEHRENFFEIWPGQSK